MDHMEEKTPRQMALARAIRRAYGEEAKITQGELGARLGIKQNIVSRWSRGEVTPELEDVVRIEDACKLRRGLLLRLAGYVEDPTDVVTALQTDEALSPEARREMIGYYRWRRFLDRNPIRVSAGAIDRIREHGRAVGLSRVEINALLEGVYEEPEETDERRGA